MAGRLQIALSLLCAACLLPAARGEVNAEYDPINVGQIDGLQDTFKVLGATGDGGEDPFKSLFTDDDEEGKPKPAAAAAPAASDAAKPAVAAAPGADPVKAKALRERIFGAAATPEGQKAGADVDRYRSKIAGIKDKFRGMFGTGGNAEAGAPMISAPAMDNIMKKIDAVLPPKAEEAKKPVAPIADQVKSMSRPHSQQAEKAESESAGNAFSGVMDIIEGEVMDLVKDEAVDPSAGGAGGAGGLGLGGLGMLKGMFKGNKKKGMFANDIKGPTIQEDISKISTDLDNMKNTARDFIGKLSNITGNSRFQKLINKRRHDNEEFKKRMLLSQPLGAQQRLGDLDDDAHPSSLLELERGEDEGPFQEARRRMLEKMGRGKNATPQAASSNRTRSRSFPARTASATASSQEAQTASATASSQELESAVENTTEAAADGKLSGNFFSDTQGHVQAISDKFKKFGDFFKNSMKSAIHGTTDGLSIKGMDKFLGKDPTEKHEQK